MKQSSIAGTALQAMSQKITAEFYACAEHSFRIVKHCHAEKHDYTPSHKGQAMTLKSASQQLVTA